MATVGIVLAVIAAVALLAWLAISALPEERKRRFAKGANRLFNGAEARGLFPRQPAFVHDYHRDYPGLKALEDGAAAVREECLELLGIKERLTDIEALGGNYTTGGIHAIRWKSFMFKSGEFIGSNCALAPRTTALLKDIRGLYTAFFSILDPNQYITPHFGYYKGFLRYHLGVLIPDNNAGNKCWLRINADREDNLRRDRSLIETGERYYWREGEGVIFDDTYLHDASNESDAVRVVLWLDIRRKMPFYLNWLNVFFLFIAHRDGSLRKIRETATIARS